MKMVNAWGAVGLVFGGRAKVMLVSAAFTASCFAFGDSATIAFHDGQNGYRTTDMSNVQVQAGSALDLTAVGAQDARWMGFVAGWWQIEPLFEKDPADYGGDWKKAFDDYAVQIRRQGFNFFRFHGLLDAGYRAFEHIDVPPPDYMDKIDYLAYTLGKHGVRLYVDLVAYGMRYPKRERKNIDLKAGVLFGVPRYLEQWETCVRAVLGHVNPYTGKMWKDDENIVAVCQFNEQSTGAKIGLEAAWKGLDPETKAFFLGNWKAWMAKNGRATEAQLAAFTLDTPLPAFYASKGFGRDLHLYLSELAVERTKWYDRICRDAGYRGLLTSFNSNVDWGACAARWSAGDAVPYNIHQGHPHGGGQGYKGAKVDCNDSFRRTVEGSCFCYGNRIKAADRPFIVTEFSHAFWNPNRHQVGLITAYHALNGYKGLLWHAGGTQLKATGKWPRGGVGVFEVATSPCMRAAAFLSSCLYLRGDVRTSEKRVSVAVPKDYWQAHTADAPSSSQARIGLVCNYGIEFPDLPRTPGLGAYPKADITIAPGTGDEIENGLWVSNVKGKGMEDFDMDAFVAKLKAKGLVKPDNRTNAKTGVYESETGELLMRGYEHYLQAVTPRTEAVCLEAGTSAKLGRMEVRSTSVNGCIALTSVDGHPIGDSSRMVFLYITREANEGMVTSADGKTMVNMGGYPALLQTGVVDVRLDLPARDWQLYLLGYGGERLERLPVQEENGRFVLKLDTAKFRHGPTPFFELAKADRS